MILIHALLLAVATHNPTPRSLPGLVARTPCDVVSAGEVETLIGRPVTRGPVRRVVRDSTCEYTAGEMVVTIAARRSATAIDLPAELGNLKKSFSEGTMTGVDGLGAAAILVDLGDAGALLNIFRNDHDYLMISILGLDDTPKAKAAVLRIGRSVLDRL